MFAVRFLAAAALLLAALPPAYGRSMSPYASDCADADPVNYDDVYRCASSYRHKQTGQSGFEAPFSRSSTECAYLQTHYAAALRASGIANANATNAKGRARIPSCEMLAELRKDWTGEPPSWHACLQFDPARIEKHMLECLTGYLRGLKGGDNPEFGTQKAASFLPTCEEALETYERALGASHVGRTPPPDYQQPDCTMVAHVLTAMQSPTETGIAAQWGACLDYAIDNASAHIERCMTGHIAGIEDCATLISAYEGRLRAAYGGSFPVGYIRPKCFDAADMVEAAKIAAAEIEAQAAERRRQIEAAQARGTPGPSLEEVGATIARQTVMVVKGVGRASATVGKASAQIIWGGVKELVFGED